MVHQSLQAALHKLPQTLFSSRLWLVLFTLLCLSSVAQAKSNILVLGDSLSAAYGIDPEQGWVALMEQRLNRKARPYQVVNASISGETSGGGLKRLPKLLDTHNPDIVIIELGANDGLRGYPLKRMIGNLEQMIRLSQQQNARVLLAGMKIPPNYGPIYSLKFEKVYRRLEDQYDIPLIPFFLDNVAGKRELIQRDGLHPTAEAQPIILDNVWPYLEPLMD
ncbi:MAG: arylesterase [Candidatus Pelagadaptatus aseana]|uniref:arylesterase n=1 Tax=Candidatus Pelagadaptatus aseana TaxID=3120508 RepID=UPI0039B26DE6